MANSLVAIVTGGAQGLGAAICKELLRKGYRVCVADIEESKAKRFLEEQKTHHKGRVMASNCDVTRESDFARTFDKTLETFHKIDVLVNNAGIVIEQDPRKVLDVNLMGPIIGCQTARKYMGKSNGKNGGSVINVASLSGFLPHSAFPVYTATKHGIVGLTRSYGLPYHWNKDGIMYAALCPFFIATEFISQAGTKTLDSNLDLTKRKDLMSPDYVAKGVSKLLEDKMNGATLIVTKDGYRYIGYQDEFKNTSLR